MAFSSMSLNVLSFGLSLLSMTTQDWNGMSNQEEEGFFLRRFHGFQLLHIGQRGALSAVRTKENGD
jgi:hypothetical protein